MSLTDLISNENSQRLRDEFKKVFPRPKITLADDVLAPPLTKNYSIVGGAFDYLLRFTIERRYESKAKSRGVWIADGAYSRILTKVESETSDMIRVGYQRLTLQKRTEFIERLKSAYTDAKQNYANYLSDGLLTDSLIVSSLFLARLDVYIRKRIIDDSIGHEAELDIIDLRHLLSIVKEELFTVNDLCFLNPSFGDGSRLVGGADADLIIDDTLIDVKVVTKLQLDRVLLNQLLGYYVLSLIGGVNSDPDLKPIKNVAIYFARHGVLKKMQISDFASEDKILKFKDWFIKYVKKNYQ